MIKAAWIASLFMFIATSAFTEECRTLLSLPPRGVNCFYCMHAKAPDYATPIVNLLLQSCLKSPAISFVLDGSFGYRREVVEEAITALASAGRTPSVHLYLYNGPAQRRWQSGVFKSFAMMDPVAFRLKIRKNRKLRAAYSREVQQKVVPLLELAKSLKVKIYLAPALEDNLDAASFKAALTLIKKQIPRALFPTFVRSACHNCAIGNDFSLMRGVRKEKHTADYNFELSGGIISTDGEYFYFPGEAPHNLSPTRDLDDLVSLMKKAGDLKNVFLLWVPKYQDAPPGVTPRSPNTREYKAPTESETRLLIEFLRQD